MVLSRNPLKCVTESTKLFDFDEFRFGIELFSQGTFSCIIRSSCRRIYGNEFTDHGTRRFLLHRNHDMTQNQWKSREINGKPIENQWKIDGYDRYHATGEIYYIVIAMSLWASIFEICKFISVNPFAGWPDNAGECSLWKLFNSKTEFVKNKKLCKFCDTFQWIST